MNKLLIGYADKTEQLLNLPRGDFLLIADDIEAFAEHFPDSKIFNPRRTSFNPLPMSYKQAREFAETLYAVSPEAENTLTVRNGRRALTKLFMSGATRFGDYPSPDQTTDPYEREALAMIEDLLLSPVLRRVLCRTPNFALSGQILAKLDRSVLGDHDAFLLASILIARFHGQIVVPDFGFYGQDFHTTLIRQHRLTAGLNSLSEVSRTLTQALLGINEKVVYRVTREDAEKLMFYVDSRGNPNILVEQKPDEFKEAH